MHKDVSTDFCLKGDNYITKKVSVVSLARDTPTGSPLHPFQLLSNYLKQYDSYGLHKGFSFGGDKYITRTVSYLLHATRLLVLLFIPTKYYQIMSKGIKVMECTRMDGQTVAMLIAISPEPASTDGRTDSRHADRYIPRTYLSGIKMENWYGCVVHFCLYIRKKYGKYYLIHGYDRIAPGDLMLSINFRNV